MRAKAALPQGAGRRGHRAGPRSVSFRRRNVLGPAASGARKRGPSCAASHSSATSGAASRPVAVSGSGGVCLAQKPRPCMRLSAELTFQMRGGVGAGPEPADAWAPNGHEGWESAPGQPAQVAAAPVTDTARHPRRGESQLLFLTAGRSSRPAFLSHFHFLRASGVFHVGGTLPRVA